MLERFKKTKFYLGWVKFINDLRPMTWKKRLEYLWMYYKEYAYCAGIVLIAISLLVTILVKQTKESVVSGMIINTTMRQEGFNYLSQDYKEVLAPDDKNKIVELDYTTFGDPLDPENGQNSYYASMILTARVSGAMLDYIIMDKFAMEYYITQEVYLDLREFFTEAELAALDAQDKVIYAMQEGDTDRWPIAINITDMPFVQDNVTSGEDTYFALSGNVRSLEMCRDVWNRLNAWESNE